MMIHEMVDDILKTAEDIRKYKTKKYVDSVRQRFIHDEINTSKIYTRDKNKYPFKVYKMKSGIYALIDNNRNILYKNNSVHLCKVEFIIKTMVEDGTLAIFADKL